MPTAKSIILDTGFGEKAASLVSLASIMRKSEDDYRDKPSGEFGGTGGNAIMAFTGPNSGAASMIPEGLKKIMHPDDIKAFILLIEDLHNTNFQAQEMPEVEKFWNNVWVPMVPTQGTVYDFLDEDMQVQSYPKEGRKKTGQILVAVGVKVNENDMTLADPKKPQDVTFWVHHTGSRDNGTFKSSNNVIVLNAIATVPALGYNEAKGVRVGIWEQTNVTDINSLRAHVRAGNLPYAYVLLRINWPFYPDWSSD